ncbi:delta endotoxin [Annulohypoxylon truncatum]|uniref:delta endotoxin n=1 Tax=Annulohypoxylon truncatum TaxID=327061 RepID=UPI002007DEFF|nr:delta endotoxin [Annulohypoxylon truncatum]KAI1210211.1 delta endotoxin [Annulohypoxylon truncatum]
MNVNDKFINDLLTKVMKAAESGISIDFNDGDEVGQYVISILALGAELIPVIGGVLGAFTSLLGAIFFSSPMSMEKIWEGLRERIEKLIDSKIEQYHLEVLRQRIKGIQENMKVYRQYLKDFKNATGADKEQAARTLQTSHVAFSSVVLAALPQFQLDRFAVVSLPLFALVANIYLALLVDGIKQGREWGYSPQNIKAMEAQFRAKTSPQQGYRMPDDKDLSRQKSCLENAIKAGPALGIPANVIDTWKEAYADLFESGKSPKDSNDDVDYVSYAKKIYIQGRYQVKPYEDVGDKGGADAGKYRAYAEYDTSMIMNVLNYAELWPFMTGASMTESAMKNLDREIFYGPFGRYAYYSSWDPSTPPRVDNRSSPITSLIVRAWDDIDGMQIKQGQSWGSWQGSSTGGAPKQLDLWADEWIKSFEVTYGHKLGKVKFVTNKGRSIENGNARHATIKKSGAPPGYELTSVIITNYESHIPPGCEGIILGFRPLMTDPSRG